MYRIEFKIPNAHGKFLGKILEGIDNKAYIWFIPDYDSEVSEGSNDYFFEKMKYTNDEFLPLIHDHIYYTIFLNLQLYKSDNIEEINNYSDFVNSNCIFILFITDNEFVEIYCKDEELFEKVKKNIIDNKFTDIKELTDKDRLRKRFSSYSD